MTNQETEQLLKLLKERQEYLLGVVLQIGMMTDWIVIRMQETTDADDKPIIDLKMEEFAAWGEQQLEDLRQHQAGQAFGASPVAPTTPKVDLDE